MYGFANPFYSRMNNKLGGTSGLGFINRNSDMMAGQTQMPNLNFQPTMAPPVALQQQQPQQSFPQAGGLLGGALGEEPQGLLSLLGLFGGGGGFSSTQLGQIIKSLKG